MATTIMNLLVNAYIIVGYVLIAVCLPRIVFSVRRSYPSLALVASLWMILAAAIQTNIKRGDSPLVISDVLRVGGVTLFIVYLILHQRAAHGSST